MRLRTFGVGERDALGDEPARARGKRRGDQMRRAFDPQACVGRKRVCETRGIDRARQIGQLMNDGLRTGANRRVPQGGRIEDIHDHGVHAGRFQRGGFFGRPGRSRDAVPGSEQQRHKPPADDAGRAGKKNPHDRP